jgi:hypothetical protein
MFEVFVGKNKRLLARGHRIRQFQQAITAASSSNIVSAGKYLGYFPQFPNYIAVRLIIRNGASASSDPRTDVALGFGTDNILPKQNVCSLLAEKLDSDESGGNQNKKEPRTHVMTAPKT